MKLSVLACGVLSFSLFGCNVQNFRSVKNSEMTSSVLAPVAQGESLSGTLVPVVADDHLHGTAQESVALLVNGTPYPVNGTVEPQLLNHTVTLNGATLNAGTININQAQIQVAPNPKATVQSTSGILKVGIIAISFTDSPMHSTAAQIQSAAFDAPDSMRERFDYVSGGVLKLEGAVVGPIPISAAVSGATCDTSRIYQYKEEAKRIAIQQGKWTGPFDIEVLAMPWMSTCWYGGLAVGSNFSILNGAETSAYIMTHEVGHNLGLNHSGDRSPNGVDSTYGDESCVMGRGAIPNSLNRDQLGWLPQERKQTVSSGGIFELHATRPQSVASQGVEMITAGPYYLTFRPGDEPEGMAVPNYLKDKLLVHIRQENSAGPGRPILLKALDVNQDFADSNGWKILNRGISGGKLSVSIQTPNDPQPVLLSTTILSSSPHRGDTVRVRLRVRHTQKIEAYAGFGYFPPYRGISSADRTIVGTLQEPSEVDLSLSSVAEGPIHLKLTGPTGQQIKTEVAISLATPFTDMDDSHLGTNYARLVKEMGVMPTCGDRTFCPDHILTRAEASDVIIRGMRYKGLQTQAPATPYFADVSPNHPQFEAIQLMMLLKITSGTRAADPTANPPVAALFSPDEPINRGQAAVFLTRAIMGSGTAAFSYPEQQMFTDVPAPSVATGSPGHLFFKHIQFIADRKITRGCRAPTASALGDFCPDQQIPRWQMAIFLARSFIDAWLPFGETW